MPIKPENKKLYPPNWKELSLSLREAAGWRCQGSPQFPECKAEQGKPHPETGSKVVLTVAHLDQDPRNNEPDNLRVLCQRCHLTWDAPFNAKKANRTKKYGKRNRAQYSLMLQLSLFKNSK